MAFKIQDDALQKLFNVVCCDAHLGTKSRVKQGVNTSTPQGPGVAKGAKGVKWDLGRARRGLLGFVCIARLLLLRERGKCATV